MSNKVDLNAQNELNQPEIYQIRFKGYLSSLRREWFDGLTITQEGNGDTLLTGPVVDQAALYGLLKRVRDAGMVLLSVNPVKFEAGPADNL